MSQPEFLFYLSYGGLRDQTWIATIIVPFGIPHSIPRDLVFKAQGVASWLGLLQASLSFNHYILLNFHIATSFHFHTFLIISLPLPKPPY